MLSSDDMKFADVETIRKTNLFTEEELAEIRKQRHSGDISLPPIALMTDWKMGDVKSKLNVSLLCRFATQNGSNVAQILPDTKVVSVRLCLNPSHLCHYYNNFFFANSRR